MVQLFAVPHATPPPKDAAPPLVLPLYAKLPVTRQLSNVELIAPPPQAAELPFRTQLSRVRCAAPPPSLPELADSTQLLR